MYDIEWINSTRPTVDYSDSAQADYNADAEAPVIDRYTARFEAEFGLAKGEDIGGLIVYAEGKIVYDYENFCGWIA